MATHEALLIGRAVLDHVYHAVETALAPAVAVKVSMQGIGDGTVSHLTTRAVLEHAYGMTDTLPATKAVLWHAYRAADDCDSGVQARAVLRHVYCTVESSRLVQDQIAVQKAVALAVSHASASVNRQARSVAASAVESAIHSTSQRLHGLAASTASLHVGTCIRKVSQGLRVGLSQDSPLRKQSVLDQVESLVQEAVNAGVEEALWKPPIVEAPSPPATYEEDDDGLFPQTLSSIALQAPEPEALPLPSSWSLEDAKQDRQANGSLGDINEETEVGDKAAREEHLESTILDEHHQHKEEVATPMSSGLDDGSELHDLFEGGSSRSSSSACWDGIVRLPSDDHSRGRGPHRPVQSRLLVPAQQLPTRPTGFDREHLLSALYGPEADAKLTRKADSPRTPSARAPAPVTRPEPPRPRIGPPVQKRSARTAKSSGKTSAAASSSSTPASSRCQPRQVDQKSLGWQKADQARLRERFKENLYQARAKESERNYAKQLVNDCHWLLRAAEVERECREQEQRWWQRAQARRALADQRRQQLSERSQEMTDIFYGRMFPPSPSASPRRSIDEPRRAQSSRTSSKISTPRRLPQLREGEVQSIEDSEDMQLFFSAYQQAVGRTVRAVGSPQEPCLMGGSLLRKPQPREARTPRPPIQIKVVVASLLGGESASVRAPSKEVPPAS